MFRDAPVILAEEELEGDFSIFRAPGVKLSAGNDLELVQALAEESSKENIDVIQLKKNMQGSLREEVSLDHGVTVPLYYLQAAGTARRCVAITFTLLPYGDLFRFGQALQRAVSAVGRKVAVVASADLSHRLTRDAPAGYHPRGREFDAQVVEYLQGYHVEKLLAMDQELVSAAGECGLRSLIILLGSLSGLSVQPRILSYEGPFGVGYPVALLKLLTEKDRRAKMAEKESRAGNIYLEIARRALESRVKGEDFSLPRDLPGELQQPGAAFVTLKKQGDLRGCIGTVSPTKKSLAEEIAANAISAGLKDPRFSPVSPGEMEMLSYSVDVLTTPEKVESLAGARSAALWGNCALWPADRFTASGFGRN